MSLIKQKGTSTVEFAIMLPLLLLLVVMVAEFGIHVLPVERRDQVCTNCCPLFVRCLGQ